MNTVPALRATQRLQFHRDFTLDHAVDLVPYFARLGISHIYASPLLTATPGSMHGYDTVDWHSIDPERGGEAGLERLAASLRDHGMGLILDIVPNHMGIGHHNAWWQDVLRHGFKSRYARYFDIDWHPADSSLHGKVLLPFLGGTLKDTLDKREITLHYSTTAKAFVLRYGEHRFPVSPGDTDAILAQAGVAGAPTFDDHEGAHALEQIASAFAPHTGRGQARLSDLIDRQNYRLAWWRTAGDLVNWRRFFDVTTLAALHMDDEDVFQDTHSYVFDLYKRGLIDGLRIDHIDGLARPEHYCRRLRAKLDALLPERPAGLRAQATIHIEKILEEQEKLPEAWPVTGTTGYEFLDQASLLLHHPEGAVPLTALWERLGPTRYGTVQRRARSEKISSSFHGERDALASALLTVFPPSGDVTAHAVRTVLNAILLAFPVYRTYFADGTNTPQDRDALRRACDDARQHLPSYQHDLLRQIADILRGTSATPVRQDIVERFEHLTAPLTAKAGEDTAFYRYARLLSRNDVGTDPAVFARSPEHFHEANAARLLRTPDALLATATHDHKRGEDGRARLAVLSEPDANWPDTVEKWFALNASRRVHTRHGLAPTRADELFIYQTLISAWPVVREEMNDLPQRLHDYLIKALREAAHHTSWSLPDETYETACLNFMDALREPPFLQIFTAYLDRIMPSAVLNSLSQTLLHFTSPGVPDLYQGREGWDFSLVDPDNRRPVDYPLRQTQIGNTDRFSVCATRWRDGQVKQTLIHRILTHRAAHPELFARGDYTALEPRGPLAHHVAAFRRDIDNQSVLVVAPRHSMALSPDDMLRATNEGWRTTTIAAAGRWRSLLHAATIDNRGDRISLAHFDRDDTVPLDILVPA